MKIAEALLLRADLQKKFLSLKERIEANAVVQDGEKPHEKVEDLLREAVSVAKESEALALKIGIANQKHELSKGRSLAAALSERKTIAMQHALVTAAIAGTKKEPDRYGVREIKWVATVSVKACQKRLEDLAKALRVLNTKIQEANWKFDV